MRALEGQSALTLKSKSKDEKESFERSLTSQSTLIKGEWVRDLSCVSVWAFKDQSR